MRGATLFVFALLICQALAGPGFEKSILRDSDPVLDEEIIADVNAGSTWTAEMSPRFKDMTVGEAKTLLGTDLSVESNLPVKTYSSNGDLPDSFDAREQWSSYIHPIRNQEKCGSCWAFAASEVLSDRFGIVSKGAENAVLSPESLVSCDKTDNGCEGGKN